MKKHILLSLVLSVLFLGLSAQSASRVTLNQGGYAGASFTVTVPVPTVKTQKITTDGSLAQFSILNVEGATHLFRNGEPDLPVVSQIIDIPLCADVEVTVTGVQTQTLQLTHPVLPMQPAPSKSDKGPRPFEMDAALYATDAFYAAPEVAWVDVIGVARDRRLAALRVSPVIYNPVTGQAEVITSLQVTLTYKGVDEAATRQLRRRYYSPAFSLGSDILATLPAEKSVRSAAPLHYLIVAHSSFRGQLDEFINWKRRLGMIVTVGYTDESAVGTTSTSIANYVKGFYTNATNELPAPTYLLIVGDHDQIPAFNARCSSPANDHITDLYYVTWDNDNIPDCYRGRFSAQNVSQLTPQVEKTLLYERYNFSDPSYLSRGVLIAGVDGGYSSDNAYAYADPTMDYVAKTYVNAANGFTTVKYYKNNTSFAPTGVTVTGSSQSSNTASTLRSLYNSGYGWVNYSAHGSETSWGDPEFTTSQVAQMTNKDKPGIFIGNCCLTGKFEVATCFGESLLRRGENAGGVAYIGGTNSTYWPQDFCWSVGVRNNISGTMNASYDANNLGMYDRLFHTHNEDYTLWHNTLGSMVTAGNMAVEAYGSYALYYWEIYQLFGDPSLIPWLGVPSDMPFNGAATMMAGTETYSFTTAPRAYVALTRGDNHDLIAAAYADATTGDVTLQLPSDLAPGTCELAITAQGFKPLFSEVSVIVPSGPYLTTQTITPQGGKIIPGQANLFDVTIANNGVAPAWSGTLSASSAAEGIVSLLPTLTLPTINNGDTVTLTSAFSLFVPQGYAYGDIFRTEVTLQFEDRTSSKSFSCQVSSPRLEVSNISASNINHGATATISCTLTNTGDMPTDSLTISLHNYFGMVTQISRPMHVGVLVPDQSINLTFTVQMADTLIQNTIPFSLEATSPAGTYTIQQLTFNGPNAAIEDFETGDFSAFNWQRGNNAWEITQSTVHSGTYSARSKSNLGNRRTSQFSISWTSNADDSISFWYMVSSEEDYDFFTFSIDGSEVMQASGTDVTTWRRASFPVTEGTHTFKFAYAKDWGSTAGSDCAWVDDITFPLSGVPTYYLFDTVCQGTEYTFAGVPVNTDNLGNQILTDSLDPTYMVLLALTVAGAPDVTITTTGSLVQGGQAVLTAHGATSYRWNTGDTTASIVVSPDQSTTYTVTGYRGGCSSEATAQIGVGIHDSQLSTLNSQLIVYPNPTRDVLHVVCPDARRITLVNIMGQVVYQKEFSILNSQFSILNCSSLPNGVYFLKVETPEGTAVKKVMKR